MSRDLPARRVDREGACPMARSALRIVAGHIGFPWANETISLGTKHPYVYTDTSAR